MSVIQQIQEKYAKLMAVIIAIALITFVVMLAFENGGNLFSGAGSSTVGKINGSSIEYAQFLKKVDQAEQNLEAQYAQYGGATPPGLAQQAIDNAWNEEVDQSILKGELNKLGINVGKKEMGEILYGQNAPEDLKRLFTDKTTGVFNPQLAKSNIDQLLKMKKGNEDQMKERERFINYINYLENTRLRDKYNSLFANSVNVPKWLIEKENADRSQIAKVSYIKETYAANIDSTIKITDKEIEEYISKRKKEFKQQESRSITYVTFSALPNASDTAAALNKVLQLKAELDSTNDVKRFLAQQGASLEVEPAPYGGTQMYESYVGAAHIQVPVKDSIFRIPVGTVYGPYLDGGGYSIAKLMGGRTIPDTVKVRHILIAYEKRNPETNEVIEQRDSTRARAIADSVQTLLRNGANFDSLAARISDDAGSKDKGGVYDNVPSNGGMVAEFNDFIFGNPVGSKGLVKTQFGYHYIENLSQKGSSPGYKIAYISKKIETSSETINNALSEASLFAGDSRDQKTFDANAEKLKAKGIIKNMASDIQPSGYQVTGLGMSRPFVKSIYKAKLGEVLDPEKVGDNYVVAMVTEINEEGTLSAAKARPRVEETLRKKKIAEKLKQKIGKPASLEAVATALGGRAIETADSLRMSGQQTVPSAMALGAEQRVIGASFNPANRGKVVPEVIEGVDGVFVIRVDNVMATAVADANVAEQRKARYQQGKQQATYRTPLQALRQAAKIKDRRSEFF